MHVYHGVMHIMMLKCMVHTTSNIMNTHMTRDASTKAHPYSGRHTLVCVNVSISDKLMCMAVYVW